MKSFDNIIRVIVLFVIHFQKDTCKRFIYTKLVHFNRRRFASDFKAKMEDRRLKSLSKEEQKKFLDSFDTVLCDVDGVLATGIVNHIEGAADAVHTIRKLKKIYFITNNNTASMDLFLKRNEAFGMVKEEVVRPAISIIWYLNKLKFDKEIYVIGFEPLRNELEEAGYKVVYDEAAPVPETFEGLASILKNVRPTVGAVVIDFSFNVNFFQLQTALNYIQHHNALFFTGAMDFVTPFGKHNVIAGGWFVRMIQEISGVAPKIMSKPGVEFQKLVDENLGPLDHKRCLVIGDSVETDMSFATQCGMQKLLTLTGATKEKDLVNWKYDESWKPDFVVDSIKDLGDIINELKQTHKL